MGTRIKCFTTKLFSLFQKKKKKSNLLCLNKKKKKVLITLLFKKNNNAVSDLKSALYVYENRV